MHSIETLLLGSAILVILCVLASKATGRLGIPTLVVFLGVGILAGSEGLGGIEFDNAKAAQSLGIVALTYILFSGGLDTKWSSIKPILKQGIVLSTLGVLLTCILVGSFIFYILGFPLIESFLIGAIISSTDAGAVFTILRSKNIHLKEPLKPLLELESGSNDPMAVFLTVSLLKMLEAPATFGALDMIPLFFKQMLFGSFIGFYSGKIIVWLFNKIKLQIEGLYIVLSIAMVIFIYSGTQYMQGNGFLAVYIAGVVMGNNKFVFKKLLVQVHDGLSWLMQSAMFLTLGLLIYPSRILNVALPSVYVALFMIIFARPISVFISLALSKLSVREKGLISWVGLRGSVAVTMATYPLVAGLDESGLIFNLVFFVALSSLIIQGTTVPYLSRIFKVDDPNPVIKSAHPSTPGHLKDVVIVDVPFKSPIIGKSIVDLDLTEREVLIIAIERKGEVIIPRGTTTIEAYDKISIMADDEQLENFVEMLWIPESLRRKKRIFLSSYNRTRTTH